VEIWQTFRQIHVETNLGRVFGDETKVESASILDQDVGKTKTLTKENHVEQ